MNGVALYESIAARWPGLPVIFSTGHGDREHLERHLPHQNVGFLLKLYETDTLFHEIRTRIP